MPKPTPLPLMLAVAACAAPGEVPPLTPRAAELIDPRLPVRPEQPAQPPSAELAARLAELIARARQGDAAFQAAAGEAERLAAAAGPPQSESWVSAQQAVSAAVAAREPTVLALADIDSIVAASLAAQGGMAPGNFAAVEAAAAEVAALDKAQARRIDALQARLRA